MTRSPYQFDVTAPVVAIAEAKNDNLRNGLGQCIAAMVAAREFNADGTPVHGLVTTGTAWKFLTLDSSDLTLDIREYFLTELPAILGILAHILESTAAP